MRWRISRHGTSNPSTTQHHTDAELERLGHPLRDGSAEGQHHSADHEQHQGVADAQGNTLTHCLRHRALTRRQRVGFAYGGAGVVVTQMPRFHHDFGRRAR